MPQNVIVAVDHSPEAERAAAFYLEKLHRPDNVVIVLHCIELPDKNSFKHADVQANEDDDPPPDPYKMAMQEEEMKLRLLESKFSRLFSKHQIPAALRVAVGKPSQVIWRVAQVEKAVLIILGSRRNPSGKRNSAWKILLHSPISGESITDTTLHHASCPVFVCRAKPLPVNEAGDGPRPRCASASAVEMSWRKGSHRQRHSSGDILGRIRQRFASGGGHRHGSLAESKLEEAAEKDETAAAAAMSLPTSPTTPPVSPTLMSVPETAPLPQITDRKSVV